MKLFRKTLWYNSLTGCGYRDIETAAEDALMSLPSKIKDDLPRMAEFILKNKKDIHELLGQLLGQLLEKAHPPGPLDGLSFCVVGTFSRPADKICEMIRSAGGMVRRFVTQKTTYFVTGDDVPMYTIQEAKDVGCKTISECTLMSMIRKDGKMPWEIGDKVRAIDPDTGNVFDEGVVIAVSNQEVRICPVDKLMLPPRWVNYLKYKVEKIDEI